eukprot:TRINITY_DN26987_c0_g1_i1.p1 TRINITY_DN26987_c0_g1~~TRINITY_DN26987_c0_g1_i1.p1  ORF type:complete len:388 (-),score=60.33 TRINITY_DN26987_c0_g1_i1:190-1353(-)
MWLLHSALAVLAALRGGSPRGNGTALCNSWRNNDIREHRLKPYVIWHFGDDGSQEAAAFLDRIAKICGGGAIGGGVGSNDVSSPSLPRDTDAYGSLEDMLKNRSVAASSPFTPSYFGMQVREVEMATKEPVRGLNVLDYGCGGGEMLSILHRVSGVPANQLHCIELYNGVPEERRDDFSLNILQDPIVDLTALADGIFLESFDLVTTFSVFHHIPSGDVCANALSNIFKMTKPGGVLLFSDWDSEGSPQLEGWFDVAHILLWVMMGAPAPTDETRLQIGTHYESQARWVALAGIAGFETSFNLFRGNMTVSPTGGFSKVFVRPTGSLTLSALPDVQVPRAPSTAPRPGHLRGSGGGNVGVTTAANETRSLDTVEAMARRWEPDSFRY